MAKKIEIHQRETVRRGYPYNQVGEKLRGDAQQVAVVQVQLFYRPKEHVKMTLASQDWGLLRTYNKPGGQDERADQGVLLDAERRAAQVEYS